MMSLWKLRVGVESYYLAQIASGLDEYYTGAGEAAGRWAGTGAVVGAVVGLIAFAPAAWLATLGQELHQRLVERHDHVDWRREPVLTGLYEVLPLVVEIEHQSRRIALGLG